MNKQTGVDEKVKELKENRKNVIKTWKLMIKKKNKIEENEWQDKECMKLILKTRKELRK